MATADWLRAKIGPAPQPTQPERVRRASVPGLSFFTRYLRQEMRLLHAYSGDGKVTTALSEFLPMGGVTGVEPDIANLRVARTRSYVTTGGDVDFERASLADLPFGDNEFDAVVIDGAISTAGSPERALEEVRRVLVPGGVLGARHEISSSRVLTTDSPVLERALSRKEAVAEDLGGDPDLGKRQPSLLREAGFINLRVTSSSDHRTGDDLLVELSRDGFVPLSENSFDPEEERETVYSFMTVVETVCWKPA